MGYLPKSIRQDYTGYQKDEESGLEFAQARYYNPSHGRFTSVDPLTVSASIRDPQTFNRYSYALNSPYKFTDPLGLISSSTGACGQWCEGNDGGAIGWTENYSAGEEEQTQDKNKGKPKSPPKKKQTQKKPVAKPAPKPPPATQQTAPQKETPRPTSATVTVDSVGIDSGSPDGKNPNYISGRANLTFTVLDQFGNPFEGTVAETVTSSNSNVVINKGSEKLVDGKFSDIVDGGGGTLDPKLNNRAAVETYLENNPTTTRQTATFTITGPGTNASLTIVQERTLTNVDSRTSQINAPRNGTTFRFYAQPLKITSKP